MIKTLAFFHPTALLGIFILSVQAQNFFPPAITALAPNSFRLRWPTTTNRLYQLQASPNMQAWLDLGAMVTGTGNERIVDVTNTDPKFFYRLKNGVIRPGFNQNSLEADDDNSSDLVWLSGNPAAPLGWQLQLFGQYYSYCFVNNNGNITFSSQLDDYTPTPLQDSGFRIIAPFWADVDTRNSETLVTTYGHGTVDGALAFGVNWSKVGYYNLDFQKKMDKFNYFQLVLIKRTGGFFDIEFNYAQIQWETGSANTSQGVSGLGGFSARAGISNGSNRTIELGGSGQPGAFPDTNPLNGLIYNSRNTTVPGRFLFLVRAGGEIAGALTVNAGLDQTLASGVTEAMLQGVSSNPAGGAVTVRWSVHELVPGQSNVTFSNPLILNPVINIPAGGTATLVLTATSATDSSVSASDIMEIRR